MVLITASALAVSGVVVLVVVTTIALVKATSIPSLAVADILIGASLRLQVIGVFQTITQVNQFKSASTVVGHTFVVSFLFSLFYFCCVCSNKQQE